MAQKDIDAMSRKIMTWLSEEGIYKDKVAITIWSEEPIATLIKSKEVNKSFRNYFSSLRAPPSPSRSRLSSSGGCSRDSS